MYGNRNFGGRRPSGGGFSPVKIGQELDVKIESVGEKGDGVAKEKGFVLFVPGTKEGDEVRIKVTKVLRNVGFAEVIGAATGKPSEDSESSEESEEPAEEEPKDSEDFGDESEEGSDDEEEGKEDFGEEEEK